MEALLESSTAAKSTPAQNHVDRDSAQKTPPAPLEKEVSNLVINDAGEQKFIGKLTPRIMGTSLAKLFRAYRVLIWP